MSREINPDWMTPSEQILEVARILAGGFLRVRRREMRDKAMLQTWGERVLDFPADKSVNHKTQDGLEQQECKTK